ncbi:MAG: ABC transporter permease subunit [Spirochaetes bacterium]|nr:ABC transporter permease subunit [Spirochaetota bacterium]
MKHSKFPLILTIIILTFIWAPIIILVANSFNASRFGTVWGGFTLQWYERLFADRNVWRSLENTLIVTGVSTVVSLVLGSLAGFALHRYKTKIQKVHMGIISIPLVIPDILMGMSLLLFFVSIGMPLSIVTIILGHITFCISFVAITILARLQDFDYKIVEAAKDLGAHGWTLFRKIYIPLLAPGLLAGAMLSITLSLDDFIVTFFTAGPGASTLTIHIYSMIRFGTPPVINALSTIFLMLTFLLALIYQRISRRKLN